MGHARESLKVVTMGKFLEKNFSGEEIFYFLEDSAPLQYKEMYKIRLILVFISRYNMIINRTIDKNIFMTIRMKFCGKLNTVLTGDSGF